MKVNNTALRGQKQPAPDVVNPALHLFAMFGQLRHVRIDQVVVVAVMYPAFMHQHPRRLLFETRKSFHRIGVVESLTTHVFLVIGITGLNHSDLDLLTWDSSQQSLDAFRLEQGMAGQRIPYLERM